MQGYYRILTPVNYGGNILHANTIHWLRLPETNIQKLIELGMISGIKTPPISEIPELADFSDKLEKKNIFTVQQFLEAQYDDLKSIWRRKDHIDKYKKLLIETYLLVPFDKKPCNC